MPTDHATTDLHARDYSHLDLPPEPRHLAGAALSAALLLAAPALPSAGGTLPAQEHDHEHGQSHEQSAGHDHADDGHHRGLHFTHPLFTESVSPDRKLRLNYSYFDLPEPGEEEHSASIGFEYSFGRAFSVEASLPYSFTDEAAGITEVNLKFANFALEEHGILLGYGIGAGIPTAGAAESHDQHDHEHAARRAVAAGIPGPALDGGGGSVRATLGRDHWELSPFFSLGYKGGAWELVGFGTLGIPTADVPEAEHGVSIAYDASVMYHAGSRIDLMTEIHGTGGIQGHPVGEDVVNLAPGIRWQVLPDRPLVLGVGASFPVTDSEAYDGRILASLFYHFGS